MTKSELRSTYLEKRSALTSAEHTEKSYAIIERFFHEVDLAAVRGLHCFISMRHTREVQTRPIFDRLWNEYPPIQTFAPRVDETTGELEGVKYISTSALKPNRWNIDEPIDQETVDPRSIDLVIVPLLCFDERGHRVGYGKGYYDRLFKKCRPDCIKAGVSFFPPVDQIEDVHDGDIPLDVCFTPDETYRWKRTI